MSGLAPLVASLDANGAPLRSPLTSIHGVAVIEIAGQALTPSRGGRRQAANDEGLTCTVSNGRAGGDCGEALVAFRDLAMGGMSSEPGGGET